jgi:phosphatidylglycerophosphatase B
MHTGHFTINTLILAMTQSSIKPILRAALPFYGCLLVIVWFLNPEFTACSKNSTWCTIAYWTTESAGRFGTAIMILISSVAFAFRASTVKEAVVNFFGTFVMLSVMLSVFALINEHGVKPVLQVPRPSHQYIMTQSKSEVRLDSLYTLSAADRRAFFKKLIDADTVSYENSDERILNHWLEEAGYSFPSGHSFNAFLMAGILSFFIYHLVNRKIRWLYAVPFAWAVLVAVSRVAVGAHTALDVSIGSAMGLSISQTLFYFPGTQRLLIPDKYIRN